MDNNQKYLRTLTDQQIKWIRRQRHFVIIALVCMQCAVLLGMYMYYNQRRHNCDQATLSHDQNVTEVIIGQPRQNCKQATILHDFDRNVTAVISHDYCLLVPINRTLVLKPPRTVWDLIYNDNFFQDHMYRLKTPAIDNLFPFGFYIWRSCRKQKNYLSTLTQRQNIINYTCLYAKLIIIVVDETEILRYKI